MNEEKNSDRSKSVYYYYYYIPLINSFYTICSASNSKCRTSSLSLIKLLVVAVSAGCVIASEHICKITL